ncbi:hypothetical protein ABWL39_20475 [Chitinivorax sp. PXF-14]|uniref:hypothetical protein n=1 Tax=Chitinivorax sp. PXF-14 TaxID=3230488 RepID=UPI0034667240
MNNKHRYHNGHITPADLVNGAAALQRALAWLDQHDFKPLMADVGLYAKPSITLVRSRHCEWLKARRGAEDLGVQQLEGFRARRRWQCVVEGCFVEWTEEI